MEPIDIAWQLLRKAVGIEGPVDPRRPGMSPGMNPQTGHIQQDDLPPEAYEQVDQALAEEARLRNMPTDQSEMPPPPGPKDNMRIMPPRTDEFGGLPPNMQDYARQLSALRGRPPQGTSVQDPNQVLRSMSPIELAMDTLQKRTPRSHIGGATNRDDYEALLESLEADDANMGADSAYNRTEGEYQDMMDDISDQEAERLAAEASGYDNTDSFYPKDIPVNDPMAHHELGMEHEAARAAGMEEPEIDEGEDLDDEDEWSAPGRGAVGGDAFQHRTFGLQDPVNRGPSL